MGAPTAAVTCGGAVGASDLNEPDNHAGAVQIIYRSEFVFVDGFERWCGEDDGCASARGVRLQLNSMPTKTSFPVSIS